MKNTLRIRRWVDTKADGEIEVTLVLDGKTYTVRVDAGEFSRALAHGTPVSVS